MLPPSEPLAALTALDAGLLYLFVIGPGRGEGLAAHLPGMGWLLVDACRVLAAAGSKVLPQEVLVRRFPARVLGALLTHPHEDHVDGFVDLVKRLEPERIIVSGNDPPAQHLLDAIEAQNLRARSTGERTVAKEARAAVVAIRQWEARTGRTVTPLNAGTTLWPSPVQVVGRAPDMTAAGALLGRSDLAARANELSAVLEIVWGTTRVVLGGDLPTVTTVLKAPVPVASGWDLVMSSHPQLRDHATLKVPHHASWAAMHLSLMWPVVNPRGWLVTPLHKGSNHLPSLDPNDGIDLLHLAEPSVMVTREPRVAAGRPTWRLADLRAAVGSPATGVPAVDRGRVIAPAGPLPALDAAWAVALDNAGRIVARYRGAAAFDVER